MLRVSEGDLKYKIEILDTPQTAEGLDLYRVKIPGARSPPFRLTRLLIHITPNAYQA